MPLDKNLKCYYDIYVNKKVIFVFVLSIFFLLATVVNAQTITPIKSLKEQTQDLRQKTNQDIMQLKQDNRAAIKAKMDEYKTRIQAIKDERKKLLVERIDSKISNLNKKYTTHLSDVLTKLQMILDKVKADVIDPKVLADITTAQSAIDAAKKLNDAQAAKQYVPDITTDATLRTTVGSIVSQFRLDLVADHKAVVDAKQAVQNLKSDKVMMKKATGSASL